LKATIQAQKTESAVGGHCLWGHRRTPVSGLAVAGQLVQRGCGVDVDDFAKEVDQSRGPEGSGWRL